MKVKYLFILSCFYFFYSGSLWGQCEGDINLSNQAEVNAFVANNCTEIDGDLTISGSNLYDLSGFSELSSITGNLSISNNSALTSLDGLSSLSFVGGFFWISNNDALGNLDDLNSVSSVGGTLRISYNDALENIDSLSTITSIGGDLAIFSNDVLELCCGVPNLINITEGSVTMFGNAVGCNSVNEIFSFCELSKVSILAYFDENENGELDNDEYWLNNLPFIINSPVSFYYIQNATSSYFVEPGSNNVAYDNTGNALWQTEDSYENIEIAGDTTLYFAMQPVTSIAIHGIDLTSSITRCNQSTNVWITYENRGTIITDGFVRLVSNDLPSFSYANPSVDSISNDTLFWFYENLPPTHTQQINAIFDMPGVDFIGEQLEWEADIQTWEEQAYKKAVLGSELVCAYDPNDKLVTPEGVGVENYTLFGDTLEYTIRFQNTGNDTAFTVVIEDELNAALDIQSFRPIASSHPMEAEADIDTRILTFTFNDIYLPDSNVNEVASHGFVKFQIQANDGLPNFTLIENHASIFFDFNPAIITNTVSNSFTETIPAVFSGRVFLEGIYESDGLMTNDLEGLLPLVQPYSDLIYNYDGMESLNFEPNNLNNIVDWVLVEARSGAPSSGPSPGTMVVERQAGLLLQDGTIVNPDGTTGIRFLNLLEGESYYFSVRHRNHLDVLSVTPLERNLEMTYDFTTSVDQAYGLQQQKLSEDGQAMLYTGDANADGIIQNTDYDMWFLNNAVINTYSPTDWNLDGVIQTTDYDLWFINRSKVGSVEIQDLY